MSVFPQYIQLLILAVVIVGQSCNDHQVIYPEKKELIEAVYASGKIVPENEYKLSALVSGTIVQKLVQDGDTIRAGQPLYVISNEAAQARLDAAYKAYEIARANLSENSPLLHDLRLSLQNAAVKCSTDSLNYHRRKNLWSKQIGTRDNLDNAYSAYQIARNQEKIAEQKYYSALNDLQVQYRNAHSQWVAARKEVEELYVRSDRDGIVYQTFKEAGEFVYVNEVVAMLGDKTLPVVRLAVDQQDIGSIRTGQQVLLETDAKPGEIYEATVSYIFPVMKEPDQIFRVDARFTRAPDAFYMHSSIEANIIVQRKKNTLVIPRNALSGSDSVWVNKDGKKQKVFVQTGIATLECVEILSGIDEHTPILMAVQ